MSGALVPARQTRRARSRQVGSVTPIPTTEDIVRGVQERSQRQREEVSLALQNLAARAEARHRRRAEEAVPIGFAMDRPTLDDWLEVGRQMLAAKGRRV